MPPMPCTDAVMCVQLAQSTLVLLGFYIAFHIISFCALLWVHSKKSR